MDQIIYCSSPSPVLNTPFFREIFGGKNGIELNEDTKGHIRALEFISLKGEFFCIQEQISEYICKVLHPQYPVSPLYIDIRFFSNKPVIQEIENKMTPERILKTMLEKKGLPYIWGGNYSSGIPEILEYYPPHKKLTEKEKDKWTLKGLDCSGLLYEATYGKTPRNTRELNQWGKYITDSFQPISQIIRTLQPLDMILYPGHILFVVSKDLCIESKENLGVITSNLGQKLKKLSFELKGKKVCFTVRRMNFDANITERY